MPSRSSAIRWMRFRRRRVLKRRSGESIDLLWVVCWRMLFDVDSQLFRDDLYTLYRDDLYTFRDVILTHCSRTTNPNISTHQLQQITCHRHSNDVQKTGNEFKRRDFSAHSRTRRLYSFISFRYSYAISERENKQPSQLPDWQDSTGWDHSTSSTR